MSGDDEGFEGELWTEGARGAFLAAGKPFIDELRAHMRLVASATAGSRSKPLPAADAAVTSAAVAYDDAQFELAGGPGPFVLLEPVDEDDDLYAIDTEALAPASVVTVLQRADYAVLDEEALLTAGEEAHRRLQPEHPAEDGDVQAATITASPEKRTPRVILHTLFPLIWVASRVNARGLVPR